MMIRKPRRRTTANRAPAEQLSGCVCTANIAGVADGAWGLIAPYGEHLSPDRSYVQIFDRGQAAKVVASWNSITGRAARLFKNIAHGIGARTTLPVWEGHPETDKRRWPTEKLMAEITDIRAGEAGLEGRIAWSANRARPQGPLYPSPLWWHWPPEGSPPAVYPEMLESIGLVDRPNISSVPAWTANATLAGPSGGGEPTETETAKEAMTEEQLKALRLALGLAETANAEEILTAAKAAHGASGQLATANGQLATANGQLATATASVTALTAERDAAKAELATITAERDTLRSANAALAKHALDAAEKAGLVKPADRANLEAKITANAAEGLADLAARKPELNTRGIEISGTRHDISTANARMTALETAVAERMTRDKCTREDAFARCQADPALKGLFDAMEAAKTAAA